MIKQYYTVNKPSKYTTSIKHIDNIEDVDDMFYDEDEVREMTGNKYILTGTTTNYTLVEQDCIDLAAQLKASGKKFIEVPEDLRNVLANGAYHISYYAPGVLRKGNRLYLKKGTTDEVKPCMYHVVGLCTNVIRNYMKNGGNSFNLDVTNAQSDIPGAVKLCKLLVPNWDDLTWPTNNYWDKCKKGAKVLWDNPNYFNEKK